MSNLDMEVKQGAASLAASRPIPTTLKGRVGRPVIVRSRDAGVLFGEYVGNDGPTVQLKNAVQMWKWHARSGFTLLDVATYGVTGEKCKFSIAGAGILIFGACALIDCTDLAADSIRSVVGG